MSEESKGRSRRKKSRVIDALIVVALIAFVVSAVQLVRIGLDYKQGSDSYAAVESIAQGDSDEPLIKPVPGKIIVDPDGHQMESLPENGEEPGDGGIPMYEFSGDLAALKARNPDFRGWIYVPDTRINYPIVQGADNDQYLRRTFDGTPNQAGSIFLDAAIKRGLDGKNPIIYGHNRKDGSMFANLKRFREKEFLRTHPYIYIFTEEETIVYQVFAVYVTLPDSDTYTYSFSGDDGFLDYIARMKSRSEIKTDVEISARDKIVTFSTCTNAKADTRLVVQARRMKPEELLPEEETEEESTEE